MFKKVLSYSVGLYVAALVMSGMRIGVKSLIAKTLPKEALGSYAYFNTVLLLGGALLALGLKRTLAKEVAARKEEKSFTPLVTGVLVFFVAASLILTILAGVLNQKLDWIYVMILIALGPATIFELATATLRGQLDQKREVSALIIAAALQAVCILLLIQLTRSYKAPVWGMAITYILLALGVLLYFGRRYAAEWKPRQVIGFYQSGGFRTLIMLAVPLWAVDILGIMSHQSDQLILRNQLGYSALAEYAVAFTFIGLMDQPITILSRVFLVTFAGGYYNEFSHYRQVTSLNLAFFSILSFGVIAISRPLTPILFTSEYQMVPFLVMILSITNIISSIEVVNSSLTIAVDYPQANRNAKFWTTLFYIPSAIFLVSRFGVYGAAWSNVGSWLGYALLHAFYMRRRLPKHSALAMRSFLISTALYTSAIFAVWYFKSFWLALAAIPVYLLLGQALRLWDLSQLPQLARRLIPERLALIYATETHDSQVENEDPDIQN